MASVIALEIGNAILSGVAQEIAINVADLAIRQLKAVSDPNYQCVDLEFNVLVLQRILEVAANTEELTQFNDQVNWHMYEASEVIREFKNSAPLLRFKFLSRFTKRFNEYKATLDSDIDEYEDKLGDSIDLKAIKLEVKRIVGQGSQTRLDKKVDELVKKLDAAVDADRADEAAELYWTLSNTIGQSAFSSDRLGPSVREYLQETRSAIDATPDPWESTGPDFLGVLGVRRVHLLTNDTVEFSDDFSTMSIALDKSDLASLADNLRLQETPNGIQVKIDPIVPVTVDAFTAQMLKAPADARYFSFAEPLPGALPPKNQSSGRQFLELFLVHGGYLYFDSSKNLVAANCFISNATSDPFLCFNGPHELNETMCETLLSADRFVDVTAAPLLRAGARKFCWVNPGEDLGSGDPKVWKHGAFAYLYSDGYTDQANLYSVASMADVLGVSEAEIARPSTRLLASTIGFGGDSTRRQTAPESGGCCLIS